MRRIFFVTIIYIIVTIQVVAQKTDSLKHALEGTKGIERIEILHQLVISVWLNYPDQAMLYGLEALELSKALDDTRSISKSIRLLAGVDYYKGDYESSLIRNKEALELARQLGDSVLMGNGYNNIGLLYYELGSYQAALEYLLRSHQFKLKLGETYGLPSTLNNIGLLYYQTNNFNLARDYFFEALDKAKRYNVDDIIIYSQNNIGRTYLDQGELLAARQYLKRAMKLAEEVGNINWGSVSLRTYGDLLRLEGKLDSAEIYMHRSLEASNSIEDKKGIAEVHYMFSKLALSEANYDEGVRYLDVGHKMAVELDLRQQMLNNLKMYIALYKQMGDKDKLIKYQFEYAQLRDSLFQDGISRNLALIPIKLEEEESRIRLTRQQDELKRKDFINMLLIVFALVTTPLIIILIILTRKNRIKNEQLLENNAEILAQKEEIETQKEVLIINNKELEHARDLIHAQKEELEKLNAELSKTVDKRTSELREVNEELRMTNLELDNLIYKSSHDIRGPLVRLMGVCNLALMEIKDEKAVEFFKMLDKAAKRLNNTVDKLKIVSELNRKEVIKELIDFQFLIKQNLVQNKYIEGLDNVSVETKIDQNLAFYSDPSVMDLIIFNMIQNAMQLLKVVKVQDKHDLKITIEKSNQSIIISFIIKNLQLSLSEGDGFFRMLHKDDEEHQNLGIGLYTVKQCVQKLQGELLLLNNDEDTTTFSIHLPVR